MNAPDDGSYTPADGDTMHLYGGVDASGPHGVQGLGNFILDGDSPSDDITLHGLTVFDYVDGTNDLWYYPELLSLVDNPATARWPTPVIFEKNADIIHDRGFEPPTRWITTRGVRSGFYQTEGAYKTYTANLGGGSSVQRGADGGLSGDMSITNEKGTSEVVISAFCPPNTAYGIREDKLVRYAPEGVNAIQFIADHPMVGGGQFMVARTTDGEATPVYEAPFDFYVEMGCLAPQCFCKMTNINELKDIA
jgi:hypothetical protein